MLHPPPPFMLFTPRLDIIKDKRNDSFKGVESRKKAVSLSHVFKFTLPCPY